MTFICNVPPFGPAAQPLLPISHQPKQNKAEDGTNKIEVNPTQLSDQMDHPVQSHMRETMYIKFQTPLRIALARSHENGLDPRWVKILLEAGATASTSSIGNAFLEVIQHRQR